MWGNSIGLALTPPIIRGVSTIPHFDTTFDEPPILNTGDASSVYTSFPYSLHSVDSFKIHIQIYCDLLTKTWIYCSILFLLSRDFLSALTLLMLATATATNNVYKSSRSSNKNHMFPSLFGTNTVSLPDIYIYVSTRLDFICRSVSRV